jgi:hypothetical protein
MVWSIIMKPTPLQTLAIIQIFLAASAALLFAEVNSSTEAVTCRTNTALVQRGNQWTPLTSEMTMPGGIKVFTNCEFQVNKGRTRRLEAGQTLRADGFLLNPDGSVLPVFDHIAMSQNKVMVFKDGKGEALTASLTLPDGSVINPDGSYSRPSGRRSRLVDGQLLTLAGASLKGLDTITLSNGGVVVYKSGALIRLQSAGQIMGMYDGSRVRGDGLITSRDGTTTQLNEGQTITVEGVRADW